MERVVSVLTIAGSDSGGGAGIQADLKTFAAYEVHGLSAISALTAQNTRGVTAIHVPPPSFLAAQLDALFADFRIEAVKIGMLASAEVVQGVVDALARHAPRHVVLDPVMVASSGARLMDSGALAVLKEQLLPRVTLITPNVPEAELLIDQAIRDGADAERALPSLLALGAPAVLLKGGHLPGEVVQDRLARGDQRLTLSHERFPWEGHGTGCTLSSAIAAALASGMSLEEACRDGTAYVRGALARAYQPGLSSLRVLDHWHRRRA